MRFPNKETVEMVRRQYPRGTRVALVRMEDVQAPPEGTRGTVIGVDDTASVMVSWDNGSGLNVVYGEDIIRKLKDDEVTTICYGTRRDWTSRKEAEQFFLEGTMACEGSEKDRYATILCKLVSGDMVCSDGEDSNGR